MKKRHLKQECIPVGCVPSAAVAISWEGVYVWGCLPWRVSAWGEGVSVWGCLPRGVSAQGEVSAQEGVCLGGCLSRGCTPPCEQNDLQTGVKT